MLLLLTALCAPLYAQETQPLPPVEPAPEVTQVADAADDLLGKHQLDLVIGTDFPIMVGGAVAYESPWRLRAELNGGVMPGTYVDTINWAMVEFDIYSETIAELIDVVLQNSLVLRGELGYRPFEKLGLTGSVGYQLIVLNGNTTDMSFLQSSIETGAADAVETFERSLDISVQPQFVTAEVGYEFEIKRRILIRTSFGFGYCVSSNTTIAAGEDNLSPSEEAAIDALALVGEDYLDYVFEEWVHLPMVGLQAGYRFH